MKANTHKHFASTTAFATWLKAQGIGTDRRHNYHSHAYGDPSYAARGIELIERGDDSYVSEARALMNKFSESVESPHFVWERQVVGAFPDVPALLAGEPENMWYKANRPSDREPLRVWVGTTPSVSINEWEMRARGVAIAAFAMAMSEVRPINITPYMCGSDGAGNFGIITWDISTSPLVIAQLMPNLSDIHIMRHVGKPALFHVKPNISPGWPFDRIRREDFPNMGKDDLFLPPMTVRDPLMSDPLGWLKTNIAKYGQENEE